MLIHSRKTLVLLALVLVLLAGCSSLGKEVLLDIDTTYTKESIEKEIGGFIADFGQAQSAEDQIDVWLAIENYEKTFATAQSKSYVNFYRNPNDTAASATYQEMNNLALVLAEAEIPFYRQVMDSPYLDQLEARFGEKTIKILGQYLDQFTPEQLVIQGKIDDYYVQYEQMQGDFSLVNEEGKTITWETIVQQVNSPNRAKARLGEENLVKYYQGINQASGELYLAITKLYNESARYQGYDNYFEAYYGDYEELYGYTYEDTLAFRQNVKTYMVPVYQALCAEFNQNYGKAPDAEMYFMDDVQYNQGFEELYRIDQKKSSSQLTKDVLSAIRAISPEIQTALDLMTDKQMLDVEPSAKKIGGAFTTYFYTESLPFIYSSTNEYTYVAHEFGHAFYDLNHQKPELMVQENPDITVYEVHSNGMQIIGQEQLEKLYGPDYSALALEEQVYDLFSQILTSGLNEEFQVAVYQRDDWTIDELNKLYYDLSCEYGLNTNYGDHGPKGVHYEWAYNGHLFEVPFYSLQYAMSSVAGLELWEVGQTDWPSAYNQYLRFIKCDPDLTLPKMLEEAGFRDIFSPSVMENLSEELMDYFIEDAIDLDEAA